jgi:mannose-6-phosphate isomerase-like protein (cupin superfamily)
MSKHEKVAMNELTARAVKSPKYTPSKVAYIDDYWVYLSRYEGEYPRHVHQRDQFYLVLQGIISITVDQEKFTLSAGEGMTVKAKTPHQPVTISPYAIVLHCEKYEQTKELAKQVPVTKLIEPPPGG